MTIKDELKIIQQQGNGILDPAQVVQYAQNPKTLLHSQFEWNDSAAAYQYRLWQARHLISLELVVIKDGPTFKTVRAYISLTADRTTQGGYRSTIDVLSDTDLRAQMLQEAHAEMLRFRRKFGMLSELAKVFEAMDNVK